MRLSGTNELAVIGALILVTVFMPHLVSPLVRSHVGKAVALAAVAWVSLHVSQSVALFGAVLVLSCCSGWEHLDNPTPPTCSPACPAGKMCKYKSGGSGPTECV